MFPFQALASAIASTQVMTAQQVVKGENGDEVRLHVLFSAGVASCSQLLDLNISEALPEKSWCFSKMNERICPKQTESHLIRYSASFQVLIIHFL